MKFAVCFDLAMLALLVSTVLYLLGSLAEKKRILYAAARAALMLGILNSLVYMAARWDSAGRPPFTDTFEVMVLFSTCIAIIYLIFELYYDVKFLGFPSVLLAFGVLAYSTLLFAEEIKPLMPALQNSFWLTIHVIFCFIGYAALAVTYITSLAYLLSKDPKHKVPAIFVIALSVVVPLSVVVIQMLGAGGHIDLKMGLKPVIMVVMSISTASTLVAGILFLIERRLKIGERLKGREGLPRLSYKGVIAGVPMLGIGIITGAVWADVAWGRYWSWDPKETWSLITWFIYLLYLHLRHVKSWHGPRLAWISVGGFFAVMFTFFGVNYLLSGLHAYL